MNTCATTTTMIATSPLALYKVQFFDGHLIMEIPNPVKNNDPSHSSSESLYALIDTGSPMTFSSEYSTLEICGIQYNLEKQELVSTTSISHLIHFNIQYLLGNDIMQEYHLEFTRSSIRFFDKSHFQTIILHV
ncbi:hypothetical protein FDP41_006577 [Naegleria fowleri]|uniref:Uncharacterized protein n=1 Tax=Naegleria fowleri TaxID=5763 RepID=A0A6A5BLV2_NAEFO|nr:uncharacterized protein FDP41_006577 [Naegleria fowleri]KAF0974545.1 hypothetical protein FDP41_006577 [Naegleria fowleri]CAG4708215.1 unnamed protein product [Naegleria fowleri]